MVLDIQKMSVAYPVRGRPPFVAVREVSFSVDVGESFGIVGESGCGKTSLAKAIMGIHAPSSGRILFEGHDVSRMSAASFKRYRRSVQMIFQDAAGSLNLRMTVRQMLEEVLRVHQMRPERAISHRVAELLEQVGLPSDVLHAYPREISGGQCQRVSIARCLALEPRLIIADEPVSALDVSIQARILNLIRALQRELDLAVILISHDLAVVRNICDRVAVMYQGEFVERGPAAEVMGHPQHSYTKTLLAAVPDVGRALTKEPIVNTECPLSKGCQVPDGH
jgi:peptide/nickel transport system ATP-binding protein